MSRQNILIVDDDPDIVESMRVVLEANDYNVKHAPDADHALQAIDQSKPDLIILDVMMNTLREGFQLSRRLKQNPDSKDIPILMITSIKEKTGIDFAPAAGDEAWLPVEQFLQKPVNPDTLLHKVRTLLQKNA